MAKLFKWKIADAPTGRYRSFDHRPWPYVYYGSTDGQIAGHVFPVNQWDDYAPHKVKDGSNGPLKVRVFDYSKGSQQRTSATLKAEFKTLAEAKAALEGFLSRHPEFMPDDVRLQLQGGK